MKIQHEGKILEIEPGEEVLGFESWKEIPRRAALNLDSVRYVPGKTPEGSEPEMNEAPFKVKKTPGPKPRKNKEERVTE